MNKLPRHLDPRFRPRVSSTRHHMDTRHPSAAERLHAAVVSILLASAVVAIAKLAHLPLF